MKKNLRNSGNTASGIVGRLAIEKKKTALAVCLVSLMIFMWVKVLAGKKIAASNASIVTNETSQAVQFDNEANITYIDLPTVEGRNDVITRDVFASNEWKDFSNKNNNAVLTQEVNIVPGDVAENVIKKVAENLRLEAFIMGDNPRAYINGRVVSVGDKLPVTDGADKYECEVILIEQNSVVMKCGNAEVKLKLRQVIKND